MTKLNLTTVSAEALRVPLVACLDNFTLLEITLLHRFNPTIITSTPGQTADSKKCLHIHLPASTVGVNSDSCLFAILFKHHGTIKLASLMKVNGKNKILGVGRYPAGHLLVSKSNLKNILK